MFVRRQIVVVTVVGFDRVFVAVVVVAVTPKQEFFEDEEQRDAGDQRDADAVDTVGADAEDRVGDEAEQCGA